MQNIAHVHHWIIEAQGGPTSDGICRGCGEQRTFYNSGFFDDAFAGKGRVQAERMRGQPHPRKRLLYLRGDDA